jgi:hypothetical protein
VKHRPFLTAEGAMALGIGTNLFRQLAMHEQTGAQWTAVIVLAVCTLYGLSAALGAAACTAWGIVWERRMRRLADAWTPPEHPLWPVTVPPAAQDPLAVDSTLHWHAVREQLGAEYLAEARHARGAAETVGAAAGYWGES